jgi:predicted deacylase
VAFLDRSGIVDGLILSEEEENLHYFGVHQTYPILSEHAGIFVSRLEVGRWIQAGECLGLIYHGFTGKLQAAINAPVSGLVSSLRRQPLLAEGDFVALILTAGECGG